MSHTHGHNHSSKSRLVWAALSLILLAAGTIIGRTDSGLFEDRTMEIIWYIAAFLPVGLPVMKEGWEECLKKDFFNEFVLMSIASVGAFCIGEYPEAVAVMLFYSIGESLQGMAVDRATRNIGALLDVRPERARVLRNGDFVEIPPEEAVPGDMKSARGQRACLVESHIRHFRDRIEIVASLEEEASAGSCAYSGKISERYADDEGART